MRIPNMNICVTIVLTRRQKDLYDQIKEFVLERKDVLHFPTTLNSSDRNFVKKITSAIEVRHGTETAPNGEKHLFIEFDEEEDEEDIESQEARARILRKYDQAKVVEGVIENEQLRHEKAKTVYDDRLKQWKKEYYAVSIGVLMISLLRIAKRTPAYVSDTIT